MFFEANTHDRVIRVEEQLKGLKSEVDAVRMGVADLMYNMAENAKVHAESIRGIDEKLDAIVAERAVEKGQKSVWIVIGTAIIAAMASAATIAAKFILAKFGG